MSLTLRARTRKPTQPFPGWVLLVSAVATAITVAAGVGLMSGDAEPKSAAIAWPSVGAAAIDSGGEFVTSPRADKRYAIGSVTKLVTVLVALDHIPLPDESRGPALVLTEDDAQFAKHDPGPSESLIPVTAGETLALRTLIEYTLIASSNTHARALAMRVFGDEDAFLSATRAWLDEHGLEEVTIADAAGISPQNTATATSLVALGKIADANSVVRDTVIQRGVYTPAGQWIEAVNGLLGTQGVDGLKTGHPADGTYAMIFSAEHNGVRSIGAIAGAPTLAQRNTDVVRLLAQTGQHSQPAE